jgi:hypothetical protein
MKLRWEKVSRVPRPPIWSALLVAGWLLLVLGGVLLEQRGAPPHDTCLFHRATGHPCPTCGSTRVILGLLSGTWLAALRMNPLVTLGLCLGGAWLGMRLLTGWTPTLELSPRERGVLVALGATLLIANWIWVLQTHG